MGVDIETYRAKIGTYKHSHGVNVVTQVVVINFSHGLKTVGSVLFIGILLIMAGVEQNPGPRESDFFVFSVVMAFAVTIFGVILRVTGFASLQLRDMCFVAILILAILIMNHLYYRTENETDDASAKEAVNKPNTVLPVLQSIDQTLPFANTTSDVPTGTVDTDNTWHLRTQESKSRMSQQQEYTYNETVNKPTTTLPVQRFAAEILPFADTTSDDQMGTTDSDHTGHPHAHKSNTPMSQQKEHANNKSAAYSDIDKHEHELRSTADASSQNAGTSQSASLDNISEPQDSNNDTTNQEARPKAETSLQKHGKSLHKSAREAEKLSKGISNMKETIKATEDVKETMEASASPVTISKQGEETKTQADLEPGPNVEEMTAREVSANLVNTMKLVKGHDYQGDKEVGLTDDLITESIHFGQVLTKLGLKDKHPSKISIKDVIAVSLHEAIDNDRKVIPLTDIPWFMLKRLICAHSEARDITTSNGDEDKQMDFDSVVPIMSEISEESQDISPLDIFLLVYQCCDPFLKQILFQKLYLCKMAVPFFYKTWRNKIPNPVISVWPLRYLVIENKALLTEGQIKSNEVDVLELPSKLIAFARFGRPCYSKSKLLNSLLTSQGCNTFLTLIALLEWRQDF